MLYQTFAFVYDEVMDDSLYQCWLEFTQRHVGKNQQRLLELACGTGRLALAFEEAGYDVTAVDLSEEMLAVASERINELESTSQIQFVQGDMMDLSEVGNTYEIVTCYSDSLCYMNNAYEVQQVFDSVYNVLEDEGTFIFDVHSTYQVDEVFPEYSYHYQSEDFAFLWDSYAGNKEHSIEHCLTFFVKNENDKFTRIDELHQERTYKLEHYLTMLESAGFNEVKAYADFKDDKPKDNSARWFFVCKK